MSVNSDSRSSESSDAGIDGAAQRSQAAEVRCAAICAAVTGTKA